MNWYHCAQPTYEQLELDGDWVIHEAENLLMEPESPRPAPGTPAPRSSVMVPLFPGRRRRTAAEYAQGRCPLPSTKKYLSPDVWRFSVMLFCDLSTLLRLYRTCRQLRALMNTPEFVVDWQNAAWFLQTRGCRCDRNLFYLDVVKFLEFSYDCLDIPSSRQSDVALRSTGRCVNYDLARSVPLPFVDPRTAPRCFLPGLLDVWYENWIVPMPRMTFVRVEDCHVRLPPHEVSTFWEEHHPVPEVPGEEDNETPEQKAVLAQGSQHKPPAHFVVMGPDRVNAYIEECRSVNRNPFDPAEDNSECDGFHAVRWARKRMYESAVGIQTYPLHLCLRRSDLIGRAWRHGTRHMETLFVPVQRSLLDRGGHPEQQLMGHNGPIYFSPVRYNNEAGDFVPWALSTIAVLEGLYRHAWYDSAHHVLKKMYDFAYELANEVQTDLPLHRMAQRWNHLHRRVFLGETALPNWHVGGGLPDHPIVPQETTPEAPLSDRRKQQDQAALHLMFDPHYAEYNRVINRMAEREHQYWDSQLGRPFPGLYPYLVELLGYWNERAFAGQRTESMLVHELREMMRVTDYLVRFALTIAPLTDPMTEIRRFRCLACFLGCGTSLVMFAPQFRRMPSWRPKEARKGVELANAIPRINLQYNHRYIHYLRFLNRRTLFHVADPTFPPEIYQTEINPRA